MILHLFFFVVFSEIFGEHRSRWKSLLSSEMESEGIGSTSAARWRSFRFVLHRKGYREQVETQEGALSYQHD